MRNPNVDVLSKPKPAMNAVRFVPMVFGYPQPHEYALRADTFISGIEYAKTETTGTLLYRRETYSPSAEAAERAALVAALKEWLEDFDNEAERLQLIKNRRGVIARIHTHEYLRDRAERSRKALKGAKYVQTEPTDTSNASFERRGGYES